MTRFKISNLSIGFEESFFENINAELTQPSFVCLLGLNGIGKSCLLKTLAGLTPQISGAAYFNGKELNEIPPQTLAKSMAIVLTEKIQVDYLSVYEFIAFGRSPYTDRFGRLISEDHEIISSVMKEVGVSELASKYFSDLSDGQKQKVMIARALAQKPEILILDEPTTYLDIPSKLELIQILYKLVREKKISVIMSTHDLELIKNKADQFWLMDKDGKFFEGSPESFYSSGLIDKNFFKFESEL